MYPPSCFRKKSVLGLLLVKSGLMKASLKMSLEGSGEIDLSILKEPIIMDGSMSDSGIIAEEESG